MATEKKYKLDLFRKLLPALDRRDFKLYKNLSDEEKKGFADIVALRYMSCTETENKETIEYLIQASNGANKHLWNPALSKHPELKYLTLAAIGIGHRIKHAYIKAPMGKKRNMKVFQVLRNFYPTASLDELQLFLDMNDVDALIEIAEMLGMQKEEIKEYKKEVKKVKK